MKYEVNDLDVENFDKKKMIMFFTSELYLSSEILSSRNNEEILDWSNWKKFDLLKFTMKNKKDLKDQKS